MIYSPFITSTIQKGSEAGEKVKQSFSGLSPTQLNWKPTPEQWSIAQCLEHLIVSDTLYFPIFQKVVTGKYTMTRWEKWSPLGGIFGRLLVSQMQEKAKNKLNAPRVFIPSSSPIDPGILDRFHKHLNTLIEYIGQCKESDLDTINITSPVAKAVTYSLRNAITILIQHEHRHINQAIRVMNTEGFPL